MAKLMMNLSEPKRPRTVSELPIGTWFTLPGCWPVYVKTRDGAIIITDKEHHREVGSIGERMPYDLNFQIEHDLGIPIFSVET